MALITLNKLALPTGSVIQVKSAFDNSTSIDTTSTSFVATGLSVSITPSSTSSKIFASLQGGAFYQGGTASQVTMRTTIYRDSTNLGNSDYGLNRHSGDGGTWNIHPHSCSVLDSPSSTSSLTYEVYFKNADTSANVAFGGIDRGRPTLTLFEIVG
jgi:hypothetical protein